MTLQQQLYQLLHQAIADLGYEYLGAETIQIDSQTTLRIYIDSAAGVTVEDCTRVSYQVSALLDVANILHVTYQLEISSPGIDRPLFTADHYCRFLGHKVQIVLYKTVQNRRQWSGIIHESSDEVVTLIVEGEPHRFPLQTIYKANLLHCDSSLT